MLAKYYKNVEITVQVRYTMWFFSFREPLEHFGDHFCSKCGRGVGGMTIYALNKGLEEEADAFQAQVMSSPGN